MILESIETFVVKTPLPHLGGDYFYFIKITTDDGIVGWGETAIIYGLQFFPSAYDTMMKGVFDYFVKGQRVWDREKISKSIYMSLCLARGDYISGGILSAIDIALWDIAGKYCNLPIYDLLGGKMNEKVRSYTYLYAKEDREGTTQLDGITSNSHQVWYTPELAAREALELLAEGFNAIKLDPLNLTNLSGIPPTPWALGLEELRRADNVLGAIRKAVGDKLDICIGTHGNTTPSAAKNFMKILEQYSVMWFEEPIPCENKRAMGRIADFSHVPIASGERLTGVHEFNELFQCGAVDIAQPDLGACGGITEGKKIAALAQPYYVLMAPHVWGGPVISLAAIHLDISIPNFLIQETIHKGGGFFSELLDEPIEWKDGYLIPSDRPGLGRNLVEKQLEKYLL